MTDPSSARRNAVAVAGFTGQTEVAEAGVSDPDATVRIAAVRSLARLDQLPDATLTALLNDPEPAVRIASLELAASRTSPPIVHLLDDPDSMVVEQAAWACGERTTEPQQPIARLADLARNHDDPLVREAAVAALGSLGDDAGLEAVLAATQDKPAVRRRAVLALAAFDGPDVDEAFARARDDRDRQVRDAVDELLGPAEID